MKFMLMKDMNIDHIDDVILNMIDKIKLFIYIILFNEQFLDSLEISKLNLFYK